MDKQRLGAVVIGILMISSVAGFAVTGLRFTGDATQKEELQIPPVSERAFTSQEVALLLRTGAVIVESVYAKDCAECALKDASLRTFVNKYSRYAVLSSVQTEQGDGFEKFRMIGSSGQILNIDQENVTQEGLLTTFCDFSLVKPKECLLRAYR